MLKPVGDSADQTSIFPSGKLAAAAGTNGNTMTGPQTPIPLPPILKS